MGTPVGYGLYYSAETFQYRLRLRTTGSASAATGYASVYGGNAYLTTLVRNALGAMVTGLRMTVEAREATGAGDARYARLEVPELAIDEVWSPSATFDGDIESVFELQGWKVYFYRSALVHLWFATWTGWAWTVDGSVYRSGGSGSASGAGARPLNVPVMGTPPIVDGQPIAQTPGTAVEDGPPGGSAQATVTVDGGWRYWRLGAWRTPPVTYAPRDGVSVTCGFPVGDFPDVTVTDTYNLQIVGSAESETTSAAGPPITTVVDAVGCRGLVMLLPDLPCPIVRIETPHRLTVRAHALPEVSSNASAVCAPLEVGGGVSDDDPVVEIAETPKVTRVIGDTEHAIEARLTASVPCPYLLVASGSHLATDGSVQGSHTREILFPSAMSSPAGRLAFLDQADHLWSNYASHYGCRGWGWTQMSSSWDGLPANTYWRPLRQQFHSEVELPGGEVYETRSRVVSAPMAEDALDRFREASLTDVGYRTSGVGVSRFLSKAVAPSPFVALSSASSGRWTSDIDGDTDPDDCTLTFLAGGIRLDPLGGSSATLTAQFDMNDLGSWPYAYPQGCKHVSLDWETANVESVRWEFVGVEGSVVTVTEDLPGTFEWPLGGASTKWAFSGAQDYGLGSATDTGADLPSDGISAATMADKHRALAFELLPGRTAQWLRVTVVPVDPDEPVTVKYPVFRHDETVGALVREDGPWSCALWANGPGLRLGQVGWWNYVLDQFAAGGLLLPPGRTMSALDAYCLDRTVFRGVAPDSGLDSEWAADWDPLEFAERAELARMDGDSPGPQATHAFPALRPGGLRLCLVNSMREAAPIAWLPHDARDANLVPTGAPSCSTWSLSQADTRIVAPVPGVEQREHPGGAVVTTPAGDPVAGWRLVSHTDDVDNTQSQEDHRLFVGAKGIGKLTDWHGYFVVDGGPVGAAGDVANAHDAVFGRFYRAWAADGRIRLARSDSWRPPFDFEAPVTPGPDDSQPCLSVGPRGEVWLAWRTSSGAVVAVSHDSGASFPAPSVLMASAKFPRIGHDQWGWRMEGVFEHNSGSSGPGRVKTRFQGPGDASPSSWVQLAVDLEPVGFDLSASVSRVGSWVLTLVRSGETSPREYESTDRGATWTLL
jgi:hypothetical protein